MRWPLSRRREPTPMEQLVDELVDRTNDESVVWEYILNDTYRAKYRGCSIIVDGNRFSLCADGLRLCVAPHRLLCAIDRQRIDARDAKMQSIMSRLLGGGDRG